MKSQFTHLLPTSLLTTSWKTACKVSSGVALGYGLLGGSASAQIVIDNTTPTVVDPSGSGCTGICITGGLRDGNGTGSNIFHSFSDFNISNGQTITFDRQPGIANIFSRVTGLNASSIDGILSVNSSRDIGASVDSSANLFLLNPNGIIFGNNAELNIPESFLASTANSLLFQNGNEFS
ncbi:MAG: filamentous hemagglutinin N-terminal domain-containing protein, partial [Cyanobacteria bacterium J06649_4]